MIALQILRKFRPLVVPSSCAALVLLVFITRADAQKPAGELRLIAGVESLLQWPRLKQPIRVFLPKDWTPERKWPLFLYYHGTGGRPTSALPRRYTGDTGFVIVGMTYTVIGAVAADQSKQFYKDTVAISKEVSGYLAKRVSIDPARLYVGGFSKGGWSAAYFADNHPDLIAGATIMGAGVNPYQVKHNSLSPPRFRSGTPVYVGVGQLEMNFSVSLQAREHYGGRGAKVTFDVWDGLGHQPPGSPMSEYLQQWFQIETHKGKNSKLKPLFEKWLRSVDKKAKAAGKTKPVIEYLILERAGYAPFARFLSRDQKAKLSAHLAQLRKRNDVMTEWDSRRRYESTQQKESDGGFRLKVWEKVIAEYLSIYKSAPDSTFGKRAGLDAVRILESIEEADRRRRAQDRAGVEFMYKELALIKKVRAIPASKLREEFKALRKTLTVSGSE